MTTTETHDRATPFALSETLNAIVERAPWALEVLAGFGLDTCCGGALTIAEAADRHRLDPHQILAALHERAEAAR
jgi:iron-sulfur cluster repair protein YtfE (RIC family)